MKQIKFLMLLVCAAFFGTAYSQAPAPIEVTYEYVATYTWTGAIDDVWNEPGNWTRTSNIAQPLPPAAPILADFPGVTVSAAGISQVHHVIIPVGLTNYPSLRNVSVPIVISDLTLGQGASLNLGGRTLVINGFISGPGELIGGQPQGVNVASSLTVDRLNTVSLYTDAVAMDSRFSATPVPLFEDFNDGPFGDILPGNNAGATFQFQSVIGGFSLSAQGLNAGNPIGGGLYVIQYTSPAPNSTTTVALSTKTELDEVQLLFGGVAPVYAISARFSVTDDDGSPMFLGKTVAFNAGQPAQTITNDGVVTVTTQSGNTYNYTFNASGEYVGIVSNEPIASVVIASDVFIPGLQNVGFATVDDIKIGSRTHTGGLNFSQSTDLGVKANELESLTYNLADVADAIDELTVSAPLEIRGSLIPQSGTLRASPALTPNAANLILKSSAQATAQVVSHTTAANIIGRTRVERFIPSIDAQLTNTSRNKQWRFLGLPYSNPTQIGTISGINYSLTTPTMMQFFEFANSNGSYGSGGTRNNGYQEFLQPGAAIGALDGFVAWIYDESGGSAISGTLGASQTLSTSGTLLESGQPVLKTLSFQDFGGTKLLANTGWNLISNPFASTIDWNSTAIVKTQIDQAIYRWNPRTGAWSTWNGTVGTGGNATRDQADRYIESGSSFFVKAISALPVTPSVEFGQAAKINNGISRLNQFGKNNSTMDIAQASVNNKSEKEISAFRLIVSGPGNSTPADALISLDAQDATSGFDSKYDAYFMGRPNGAAIAINDKSNKYVMQFDKPIVENGKEKRYYPLTVTVPSVGKTNLDINLEGTWNSINTVHLIDRKEGKTIPLTGKNLSYEFNMTSTQEDDRFVLAFNHVNVNEKSGITATDVRVMNNPVRSSVIDAIIAHPTAKAKSYSIVNGSGATLNKGSIQDNNSVSHRLGFGNSNANGVLFLRVDFENGESKTVKFIKL
jgi:hypothetical protein